MAGEFKTTGLSDEEKLEWIDTLEKMEKTRQEENSIRDKMARKIKENPFVPVGMIATAAALTYGVYSMRKGNKKHSQMMMRARIVAQGFTVAAILGGIVVAAGKKKAPEG